MTRLALLALAASLPLAASAQSGTKDAPKPTTQQAAAMPAAPALPDTLRPGDLPIAAPQAGETTYTVRLLAPMQQDIGTLSETTAVDGGTVTRTAVVSVPMAGQNETTTSTLDAATWATRSVTMEGSTAVGEITLADGRATGTRGTIDQPGQALEAQPVDDAAPGAYFGGGWIDQFVRVHPLTEGASHVVMVYSPRDGVQPARVTVLGEQAVKPAGGAAVTYVAVETDDGEQTLTHFVDPATRRIEVVRFSPQPGVEVEFVRDAE